MAYMSEEGYKKLMAELKEDVYKRQVWGYFPILFF